MIHGIDVSHWQKEMDWAVAAGAGARFAFIRAGSINKDTGQLYEDYRLQENAANSVPHIPYRGFYWYGRPRYSPINQANYFVDLISDLDWNLPPVLDIEENDTRLSSAVVRLWIRRFTEVVRLRTQRLAILYSRGEFLNSNVGEYPMPHSLWIARYSDTLAHPWGDYNFIPLAYQDWEYWQWTQRGDGKKWGASSQYIDLNRFFGTEADLRFRAGLIDKLGLRVAKLERRVYVLEGQSHTH